MIKSSAFVLQFFIFHSLFLLIFNAAITGESKNRQEIESKETEEAIIEVDFPYTFYDPDDLYNTSDSEANDIESGPPNLNRSSLTVNNEGLITSAASISSPLHGSQTNQSERNTFIYIKRFLKADIQFKKAFPTEDLRDEFILNLYNSMKNGPESFSKNLTPGKIVSSFNFLNCPDNSNLPACLLEYIDRQPSRFLSDYCTSRPAFQRFTRSVIHFRCGDHHFWRKLIQITGVNRFDLQSYVSMLPGITGYEKGLFALHDWKSKTKAITVALFISVIISSYWYLLRQHLFYPPGARFIELFFFFLIALRPSSLFTYRYFIWERFVDLLNSQDWYKIANRTNS